MRKKTGDIKISVLGSGTSTGVPIAACNCRVCCSNNKKNKRLRCSILIDSKNTSVLIDTTTDFRQQALLYNIKQIDAVLFTHSHADHIFGLDDLRPYNFFQKMTIPLYASEYCAQELKRIFQYVFSPDPNYQGGGLPQLELKRIKPFKPIKINEMSFIPISLLHGESETLGFRINNFAYLTDCSKIPDSSYEYLRDLDFLIIDGLREKAHPTHFNHEQAIEEVKKILPKKAYFTHISHDSEHEETNEKLSSLSNIPVELAYDGLVLEA